MAQASPSGAFLPKENPTSSGGQAAGGQAPVSLGRHLGILATVAPERLALVLKRPGQADATLTYRELDRRANQAARLLAERGVDKTSRIALALPNCLDYFVATYAIWRLGACVFPLRADLPAWERNRLFEVAGPSHVIGSFDELAQPQIRPEDLADLARFATEPLPDLIAHPYKMNATGGSTGIPKIVVRLEPGLAGADTPLANTASRALPGSEVQINLGPLYHYGPARNAFAALGAGHTLVLFDKFDPVLVLESIQAYRVRLLSLVPTMLYRLIQLPGVERYDVSSLERVALGGSKCADWVFEKALQIFGADVLWVAYGGTESIGTVSAPGREWLTHRGTCGRPLMTDLRILDAEGNVLPPGEVGEIWMRPQAGFVTEYLGAPMRKSQDGFASLGDLGWLDEEGYLYIADRRKDLIVSGGANVYPAEVEAVLLEHPEVVDSAVVGVADPEWGARVHAIVVPAEGARIDPETLKAFCKARLAAYKVPKSFSCMDALPRDGLGKLRRSALPVDA